MLSEFLSLFVNLHLGPTPCDRLLSCVYNRYFEPIAIMPNLILTFPKFLLMDLYKSNSLARKIQSLWIFRMFPIVFIQYCKIKCINQQCRMMLQRFLVKGQVSMVIVQQYSYIYVNHNTPTRTVQISKQYVYRFVFVNNSCFTCMHDIHFNHLKACLFNYLFFTRLTPEYLYQPFCLCHHSLG